MSIAGGMNLEKEWLWKTIYQLKNSPRGAKILYPQEMGDIAALPRILLVKRYPDGKDLFSVIEIKPAGMKNRLVTTARVGKNYLNLPRAEFLVKYYLIYF